MFEILFSSNDLFCMKLHIDYTNDEIKIKTGDICIPDRGTTHTILKYKRCFSDIKPTKTIISTITGLVDLKELIKLTSYCQMK